MTATAPKLVPDTAVSPQTKFAQMRADMNLGLIEREGEIDVALTALVANHHPLFVGDPGTAKSMLGRAIAEWLDGHQYEVLLSKFTDPAELFGPISIEGLKRDEYRRITAGTLVDAPVAFLDEIFKASTAILNTMLMVLNERKYRNGKAWIDCPLVMAIAASNEWPQDSETGGKELGALFDRFLFRKVVKPVRSPEGEDRLLWSPKLVVAPSAKITAAEIVRARDEAKALAYSDEAKAGFMAVLRTLEQEGIFPGDRRKRWSVDAVKAFAYLDGAAVVEKDHLEILAHTLWVVPGEQVEKTAQVVAKVANPLGMEINALLAEAREVYRGAGESGDEMAKGMAATKKLGAIVKKLAALKKQSPKADTVHKHVVGLSNQIRTRLLDALPAESNDD